MKALASTYGNGEGRIRMDGPYYLDVEGGSDGKRISWFNTDESVGGLSYPKWIGNSPNWDEDSFIPSPKWVTTCPPWAGVGGGRRLFLKNGASLSFMIAICSCCLSLPLPIDVVGQYLSPASQEYISGSIPAEQTFSLTGQEGDRQFKGLVYAEGADYASTQGVTEDWNPDKGMEIRHEGVIIGKYKTYSSQSTTFCGPPFPPPAPMLTYPCVVGWTTKDGPDIQQIYALKGDERPDVDWGAVLISTAFSAASGATMAKGFKAAKGGMEIAGAIGKELGKQVMFQAGMRMMADGLDPAGVPTPQDVQVFFLLDFE